MLRIDGSYSQERCSMVLVYQIDRYKCKIKLVSNMDILCVM